MFNSTQQPQNEQRIVNVLSILALATNRNITLSRAAQDLGFSDDYVSDFKRRHNPHSYTPDVYDQYIDLMLRYETQRSQKLTSVQHETSEQDIKKYGHKDVVTYKNPIVHPGVDSKQAKDLNVDDTYDKRSTCGENRDESGKIVNFWYRILLRDQPPFMGTLTREQMECIHANYPYVTASNCSSYFPYLTFIQFKLILRVFNINKTRLFPKSVLEEKTEEEIAEFALKAKEHASLKKMVEMKPLFIEKELRKTQQEVFDIKEDREWVNKIIDEYFNTKDIKVKEYPKINNINKGQKTLFSIMGDIHFGKKFNKSIYGRGTNKDILRERLFQIADTIISEIHTKKYNKIQILCLGDLIESILPEGMHPSHVFEMDLFGSDQVIYAINTLEEFLAYILTSTDVEINFSGIGGNHDRIGLKREEDKKRSASKIIYSMLSKLFNDEDSRINVENPDDEIISLFEDNLSVIAHHGDASLMKRKPLDIINLFKKGGSNSFSLLLNGHWHNTKVEEGINYLHLSVPSVCSTDNFIQYELGVGSQPGFIIGHRADAFGFDFKKITLY